MAYLSHRFLLPYLLVPLLSGMVVNMASGSTRLSCYQCPGTIGNASCINDPSNLGDLELCQSPWNACYKQITVRSGVQIFHRGCTSIPDNLIRKCENIGPGNIDPHNFQDSICYCAHSKCNDASSLMKSSSLVVIVLPLLLSSSVFRLMM